MSNARFISEPIPADELVQIRRTNAAFRRTLDWLGQHYDELVSSHPDMWVAFGSEGIVATGKTQEDVLAEVDLAAIERGELYTEFIPAKPLNLLL